ncbi:MAG: ATP-binding protein [Aquamicrobium sp.]|uniref:AAA family ATPase n=1 Tax=Aquamicrobium sp. TaxID=1872579 RepID=UPI00349E9325|nr:ATP-binding protein [Aquamicrobium sp.]MCO5156142.1 ATP-binding protein [Aquamicrobium sp.]
MSKRSSDNRSHEDYWNSVVNRLLELLDGTSNSTGVIVVGAANNPGKLGLHPIADI